ncbi:beta-ketoacyl-[acyl-carrier-protein] synthase family protein [Candidatus Gromoviella agglomerans]|uniref:beta-ketoacyl-[acyl-carrier-protein] synthase family protein n=1 Tax=Candidatus Gromoviella agglomerans TaxID=2806609 RepID=UPI001E2B19CF|nr:beta-ketoacyl-ACP synthase II [Candidatus Gromoviella agglomerans]
MRKRVVITGIGIVSPLGCGVDLNWKRLIAGDSGIRYLHEKEFFDSPVKIAGVVPKGENDGELLATKYFSLKDINLKKNGQFVLYAVAAAEEAIKMAHWYPSNEYQKCRTGVIIGAGIGGLEEIYNASTSLLSSGKVSTFFVPSSLINISSAMIAIKNDFRGHNSSIVTACASGADSIGAAFDMIQCGRADVFIAGGAESTVTPLGIAGFNALTALARNCEESPERASCPYDLARKGFIISEGAGVLVMENLDHAVSRGARILAELVGYGNSSDAYHITAPQESGYGAYRAMNLALKEAEISVDQISYINGHGTSTPAGDLAEIQAVLRLFGIETSVNECGLIDHNIGILNEPLVNMSSTKSAIGHALGAAGGIEAIYVIMSLMNGTLPPTLNIKNPLTELINFIPTAQSVSNFNYAMSNSFGFGGTNSCLIFKKWNE